MHLCSISHRTQRPEYAAHEDDLSVMVAAELRYHELPDSTAAQGFWGVVRKHFLRQGYSPQQLESLEFTAQKVVASFYDELQNMRRLHD